MRAAKLLGLLALLVGCSSTKIVAPPLTAKSCDASSFWDGGEECRPLAMPKIELPPGFVYQPGPEVDTSGRDARPFAAKPRPADELRSKLGGGSRNEIESAVLYSELAYALAGASVAKQRTYARRRAVASYARAAEKDPSPENLYGLAIMLEADGAGEKARDYYATLARNFPASPLTNSAPPEARAVALAAASLPGKIDGSCVANADGSLGTICFVSNAACTKVFSTPDQKCTAAPVYCYSIAGPTPETGFRQCFTERDKCAARQADTEKTVVVSSTCNGEPPTSMKIEAKPVEVKPWCMVDEGRSVPPEKRGSSCYPTAEACTKMRELIEKGLRDRGEKGHMPQCSHVARVYCFQAAYGDNCSSTQFACNQQLEATRKQSPVALPCAPYAGPR